MKKILPLLLLFVSFHLSFTADAQSSFRRLWTGLQSPQASNELPVGIAKAQTPIKKAKQKAKSELVKTQEGQWIISSGWELGTNTQLIESRESIFSHNFDTGEWLNATVPGTVLTTLVEQGIYPDPYFGLNNLAIPDTLCRMDWWYRHVFDCPEDIAGKTVRLLFNGINYKAEVFLNGKKLGNIDGAFIRGEFDITSFVRPSGNILAVHIIPPHNPGIPHEQSIIAGQGLNGGSLSLDGATFISSVGWDWMPGIRDRNIGIWQDVRLQITSGKVRIIDPQVITDVLLPDTTQAKIHIHAKLQNQSDKTVEGNLLARIENQEISMPYRLLPFESKKISFSPEDYPILYRTDARLWWPNGYGNPELYDLELEAIVNNGSSDLKKLRFGIREMSYELMVHHDSVFTRIAYTPSEIIKDGKPLFDFENRMNYDKNNQLPGLQAGVNIEDFQTFDSKDDMGAFLIIRVNGQRIFCRGGNWGMDDAMKRSSRERLEPYVKLHQEMNFNIIRNWTGESTEEVFYQLCDEYGILVWNDFWITTDDTVEPNNQTLFLNNARDVVKRFRNHPSIAIWCPRNEGFAPKGLSIPLTNILAEEDPTRHYHGQSRYLNMEGSGPWSYFDDASLYFTQNAKGFNTEMGSFAIPTASTIRKFIAPEDQWPINDVWAYHDFHHTSQNYKGFMQAIRYYGEPTDMEDFSRKAQFVCYDAWRSMLEAWNSKIWNNTSGLILWMSHPAWPSMIWQTYTYDYETPGSFFGAKKACEPVHIQRNLPDNELAIINTTLKEKKDLQMSAHCYDVSGRIVESHTKRINARANSSTDCGLSISKENKPELYLLRLILKDNKGKILSINDYWETTNSSAYEQLAQLESKNLLIKTQTKNGKIVVEVKNPSKYIIPAIKLNAVDTRTGEIILPAYFSDGYFNLLPGEKRIIELTLDEEYYKYCSVRNSFL